MVFKIPRSQVYSSEILRLPTTASQFILKRDKRRLISQATDKPTNGIMNFDRLLTTLSQDVDFMQMITKHVLKLT